MFLPKDKLCCLVRNDYYCTLCKHHWCDKCWADLLTEWQNYHIDNHVVVCTKTEQPIKWLAGTREPFLFEAM